MKKLGDGKRGLGGSTRNGVRAADRRDTRPPRGGSISVSGCLCAPTIILEPAPFSGAPSQLSFVLFQVRYFRLRQGASACTKWQIPTTHNGTSWAHPNTPARAPISMYSQSQGSSVSFSNKSEGNIQARRVVSFALKSSSVLLPICYFKPQIFDIVSHYFSKGQWAVMYKYIMSNVMCK